MNPSSNQANPAFPLSEELRYRIQRLGPVRDALVSRKCKPRDISYLSSGERCAVLLAARFEHELESPLFTFLKLDGDLQAFVLLSRERADLIGSVIGEEI